MSLLDDASIVVTPNGYKQGVLFSVIPSSGAADLEVIRGTAATRVDENGLVNYAEVIGDSALTGNNSNFDTGIGSWVGYSGGSVSHSTDKLEVTLTSAQSGAMINTNGLISGGQSGKTFKVRARIWQGTTTNITTLIYMGGSQKGIGISSTPTYFEVELTPSNTGYLTIYRASGVGGVGTFFIDDVTVKEVTRDNVPRIDYTGGGCPHILAEPMRTNLITYSEDFSNSYFQKVRSTISTDQIVSPDGTLSGDKFIEDSALGTKLLWTQDEVVSIGDVLTWSVFAKKGEREWIMLRESNAGNFTVFFDLENGVIGTSSGVDSSKIEDLGSGWYRCSITYTTTGTTARGRLYLADADNGDSYQGNGTSGLYIWGAQLEEGSYATSYIPTSGSTVTRNQDIFTRDGIGSLINSTEGVLFLEMAALQTTNTNAEYLVISDGTYNANSIMIQLRNGANQLAVWGYSGSVYQLAEIITLTDITDFNKIAIKWKVNDFEVFVNGSSVYSLGTYTAPTGLDRIEFSRNGSAHFFGKVKQLQVYKTALTDDTLALLTS